MKQTTKTKISKSLKRHYKTKKSKKDIKLLLWAILLIAITSQFIPTALASSDQKPHFRLPVNLDKTDLTVVEQIRIIAREEKFKWTDYLIRLARCENDTFDPLRDNTVGNYPADSKDRGIFQINDYWHAEVSDECAYDVRCSTLFTINAINNGNQAWWVCDSIILNK